MLFVGDTAGGTLDIAGGGVVDSAQGGIIGNALTGDGAVTISGNGSVWNTGTDTISLIVGNAGNGLLTIAGRGKVNSDGMIVLGNFVDSFGGITVNGGGQLESSDVLIVGQNGTGSLFILNGSSANVSTVSGVGAAIGNDSGGQGEVEVRGEFSVWSNTGDLHVGVNGAGRLSVNEGASVVNVNGVIGNGHPLALGPATGSVTVSGSGSSWTNIGRLEVGYSRNGTLLIEDGGLVTNGASGYAGHQPGSIGAVTVTGAGSRWLSNGGEFGIGVSGVGTLEVASGGEVRSSGVGMIGFSTTGDGTVTVHDSGSAWRHGGSLTVGGLGVGSLTISNEGLVENFDGYIADGVDSTGEVTVRDARSAWTNDGDLFIGNQSGATGTLRIVDGGAVSNHNARIGAQAGSNGAVTVDGAGSVWTNVHELYVGNDGVGTLLVLNGGRVDNTNAAIGHAIGSIGYVAVDGPGSTWASDGVIAVGNAGDGVLTVANGGKVETTAAAIALGLNGGRGRINIGGDPVTSSPTAAGIIDAPEIRFIGPYATLVFNHTDTNYAFDPALTGAGIVLHSSGTTVLTANSASFTGSTDIEGGTLRVDAIFGAAGAQLTIGDGGTLGGTGSVGGQLTVGTGGILAPGNSVGTLHVADATFDAGSIYRVELNDGGFVAGVDNDLLNASGAVTINGGTVHVTHENGAGGGTTYLPGTYTAITTTGGVTGTFDTVTDDFAFLDFTDSYDANNVFLTSSLGVSSFCLAGYTANQCATGDGVFSLGSGGLYTAVLNLSAVEAPIALDQLSGEVHASIQMALIEDSRFAREAAMDRLRVALEAIAADGQGMAERPIHDGFAFWAQGFGSWRGWDGSGNAADLERSIGGFFLGGDALVTDNLRLGVFGGYGHSSFDVDDRNATGAADTWHLGAYGGTALGNLGLRFGGAYAWHDIVTSRSVAFSGFSDSLSGSYDARTAQIFGEAGYRFDYGAASFEPFANLAYVHLKADGHAESGGAAALSAASHSMGTAFTTIGLRAETHVNSGEASARFFGMAGWRYAFGDTTPFATHAFSGGDNFTIAGVPITKNALVLDLGASVDLTPDAALGVSYSGQFGSDFTDQGIKASLAVRF